MSVIMPDYLGSDLGPKTFSECWQISPLAGKELIVGKQAMCQLKMYIKSGTQFRSKVW